MSENNNNTNGKDLVIGVLIGGIIGAGAALLLAPKSGRELRGELSEGYQTASKKTQDLAKNVSERSEVLAGKVKEVAEYVKEDVQKWKANALEVANEVKESLGSKAEGVKDEVASAVDKTIIEVEEKLEKVKK